LIFDKKDIIAIDDDEAISIDTNSELDELPTIGDSIPTSQEADHKVQIPIPRFITTFSFNNPEFFKFFNNNINVLNCDEKRILFIGLPQVVYKRPLSMGDKLIHSGLSDVDHLDFSGPCGKNCRVCPFMELADKVTSLNGKETIKIVGENSCKTTSVVYLLVCTMCGYQYGGQTETQFNVRFASHKWQSRQKGYALNDHYLKTGHTIDNFKAFILKKFAFGPEREVFESYLIKKFDLVRNGINKDDGAFSNIKIFD
jgi:hypothetical protein